MHASLRMLTIAVPVLAGNYLNSDRAHADECKDALIHAAYDRLEISTDRDVASAAKGWFCSDRFMQQASSKESGGGVTIPINGVPIGFSGSHSSAKSLAERDSFCADNSQRFSEKDLVEISGQFVRREALDAWTSCMRDRSGLGVTGIVLSPTVAGRDITVVARLQVALDGAEKITPFVLDVLVTGGTVGKGRWSEGALLTQGGLPQLFRRASEEDTVVITLVTTAGSSQPLVISGIPKPSPRPLCEAGEPAACSCPGGAQGTKRCASNGNGWGSCTGCPPKRYFWKLIGNANVRVAYGRCDRAESMVAACDQTTVGKRVSHGSGTGLELKPLTGESSNGIPWAVGSSVSVDADGRQITWSGSVGCGYDAFREVSTVIWECTLDY